jgi:hypothetical protein
MGQMGLGWFTSGPLLDLLVLALIVNAQKKKNKKLQKGITANLERRLLFWNRAKDVWYYQIQGTEPVNLHEFGVANVKIRSVRAIPCLQG